MHPDIAELVSLAFGELAAEPARRITRHLAGCAACQQEYECLRISIEYAPPTDCAENTDRVNASDSDTLLRRLRTWENSGRQIEVLKRRIAAELAPYVGQAGADTLLLPVQDDGRDLLSNVVTLLTAFLGRRAAANLVTRVVEKAIVGMGALCES